MAERVVLPQVTVDALQSKRCRYCDCLKPLDEYWANRRNRDGLESGCKSCLRERHRSWRKANPEVQSRRQRQWRKDNPEAEWRRSRRNTLKRHYGITVEQFEAQLAVQGGACALCKSTEPGGTGAFNVDHCHETGRLRGLLCTSCNSRLEHRAASGDAVAAAWVESGGVWAGPTIFVPGVLNVRREP